MGNLLILEEGQNRLKPYFDYIEKCLYFNIQKVVARLEKILYTYRRALQDWQCSAAIVAIQQYLIGSNSGQSRA
jgi:hypothetical protein